MNRPAAGSLYKLYKDSLLLSIEIERIFAVSPYSADVSKIISIFGKITTGNRNLLGLVCLDKPEKNATL